MAFSLLLDAEPLDTEADFPVLYTAEELLRRDDAKLTLGNSDANIQRMLGGLIQRYPQATSESAIVLRYIADAMTDVTREGQGKGRRLHFPLKRDRYSNRYSRYGYRVAQRGTYLMQKWGLVYFNKGNWWSFLGKGNESTIWITDEALEWTRDLVDPDDEPNPYPEVILLTSRETQKPEDYDDTAQTIEMSRQVTKINDKMISQVIFNPDGSQVRVKPGRRHFLDDFKTGGGFYFNAQSTKKEKRRQWQALVNGEKRPMAELDYDAMHPTMLYKMAGLQCVGDPYQISGYDRKLGKTAWNTLVNAKNHQAAAGSVTAGIFKSNKTPHFDPDLQEYSEHEARDVLKAMKCKHKRIRQYFCSDMGVKLQKIQADIMLEVAERMIDQTGHCPVLIHDGCHVADIYTDTCRRLMIEVAAEHGFDLGVKVNGEKTSPKTEDPKPKAKVDPSAPLMDQLLSRISQWEKNDDESILSRSPWRRNSPEASGDTVSLCGESIPGHQEWNNHDAWGKGDLYLGRKNNHYHQPPTIWGNIVPTSQNTVPKKRSEMPPEHR